MLTPGSIPEPVTTSLSPSLAEGMADSSILSVIPTDVRSDIARLRHFSVGFFSKTGRELGRHVFSFECTTDTSTDIVPFHYDGWDLRIGVTAEFRAPLAYRKLLPVVSDQETFGPHSCLRNEPGMTTRPLGGSFLPSAGSSSEICGLTAVKLERAKDIDCTNLNFINAQHIIDDYLAGKPMDMRLVLATLRLASELKVPLKIDLPIGFETLKTSALGMVVPRRSAEELEARLHSAPNDDKSAFHVECSEVTKQEKAFLKHQFLEIRAETGDGQFVTKGYGDAMVRRGIDAVDVGAYTWNQGELCLVLKRGVRPSLAAGIIAAGGTPTPTSCLAYEGIAESLEGEKTLQEIGLRAAQGVREEGGIEPLGTASYIGSSFPSSRFHCERVFNYFIEVNPYNEVEADHTVDERIDRACVGVRDIIKLCDKGVIRDPRLEINARLLANWEENSRRLAA